MAVDGSKAIPDHFRIIIVQNLNDVPECANQQYLIQMGCPAIAVMEMLAIAFPYRIVIGGGMPILLSVCAAAVGAEDLVGKQGEGRTVPIRMLQPILYLQKYRLGYDAWVAVLDKVAGQFSVVNTLLMSDVVSNICLL